MSRAINLRWGAMLELGAVLLTFILGFVSFNYLAPSLGIEVPQSMAVSPNTVSAQQNPPASPDQGNNVNSNSGRVQIPVYEQGDGGPLERHPLVYRLFDGHSAPVPYPGWLSPWEKFVLDTNWKLLTNDELDAVYTVQSRLPTDTGELPRGVQSIAERILSRNHKPRISVVQADNSGDRNYSMRWSRSVLFRYALRHGYNYQFITCNGIVAKPAVILDQCLQGYDLVAWFDTDAFVDWPDLAVEDIAASHRGDWGILIGMDLLQTIIDKKYIGPVGAGEVVVRCTPKTIEFLNTWSYMSWREDDQQVLGQLVQFPQFRDVYRVDLQHLGLYGQFTRHYAGEYKKKMKKALRSLAKDYPKISDQVLSEERMLVTKNMDGSQIYKMCPRTYPTAQINFMDLGDWPESL
eukprot:Clim_evm2s107 gene=Clim_evmTU2s107